MPRCFRSVEQRANRLIAFAGQPAVIFLDIVVIVPRLPVAVPDLHEAHAAFEQPPRDE